MVETVKQGSIANGGSTYEARPVGDDELVAELTDEATRLSGSSLRNGCPDCGIASNLASGAADRITDLQTRLERYREALSDLLAAVEAADSVKRGDFYHERKAARKALSDGEG